MAKQRKIECDCGAYLEEKRERLKNIETEVLICPKCKYITLTKEQAEKYVKLKLLHDIIDADRKIIRIGNSMGLTLPERLQEFGLKVGKKVRTKAVGTNSFLVELH
ncbi:MAG: hypothetical protein V1740_04710 [Candidatus Woesearchaeota archaeon]